jgi:hypothetical protein
MVSCGMVTPEPFVNVGDIVCPAGDSVPEHLTGRWYEVTAVTPSRVSLKMLPKTYRPTAA